MRTTTRSRTSSRTGIASGGCRCRCGGGIRRLGSNAGGSHRSRRPPIGSAGKQSGMATDWTAVGSSCSKDPRSVDTPGLARSRRGSGLSHGCYGSGPPDRGTGRGLHRTIGDRGTDRCIGGYQSRNPCVSVTRGEGAYGVVHNRRTGDNSRVVVDLRPPCVPDSPRRNHLPRCRSTHRPNCCCVLAVAATVVSIFDQIRCSTESEMVGIAGSADCCCCSSCSCCFCPSHSLLPFGCYCCSQNSNSG
mmetsp:Transcript_25642/g.70571  ORF Transcript_25642/g.70571 Transcript_25642/m.70571 type:complete len:246 (+) Transcript_25642:771-1508(+)